MLVDANTVALPVIDNAGEEKDRVDVEGPVTRVKMAPESFKPNLILESLILTRDVQLLIQNLPTCRNVQLYRSVRVGISSIFNT